MLAENLKISFTFIGLKSSFEQMSNGSKIFFVTKNINQIPVALLVDLGSTNSVSGAIELPLLRNPVEIFKTIIFALFTFYF